MSLLTRSEDDIIPQIYFLRGHRVMFDYHLAEIYGVETRVLNQAVKRNMHRFPDDFMFQLNEEEMTNLISQSVISSWGGRRKLPFVFTEHGAVMLSSVLNSEIAIQASILVVRAFVKLRQLNESYKNLETKIYTLESDVSEHSDHIQHLFNAINQLTQEQNQPRALIGFKRAE